MIKKNLLAFATLLFSFNLFAQSTASSTIAQHRVVLQLSSNDTLVWKGLMKNIENLRNAWGDSVSIEVVAHSSGIEFLTVAKTNQQEKIAYFKSNGVVFVGCENTMRERKISKESIIPEAGFVKSGVGEIILKQELGWSYLKAGF
jgi:uncharacterized protein